MFHNARVKRPPQTARPQPMPPSPEVMAAHYMEYLRVGAPQQITFFQFLAVHGLTDPAHDVSGMDDAMRWAFSDAGAEPIQIPDKPVSGPLRLKVLLVDFPNREGTLPPSHYEDLFFSEGIHPTGSVADYYAEVSRGKVKISGTVHGWLRLPHDYEYYTNQYSGIHDKGTAYPRNAQGMAEDAVKAALARDIVFEPDLDKHGEGMVTALCLVHAGRGAESITNETLAKQEIWSHKWEMRNWPQVAPKLQAVTYIAVPQECTVGVCCHELGHLALQWQDFYDPNGNDDGRHWSGTGAWDLMAGGSWNNNGATPAHPAALHKVQHEWIERETIGFELGTPSEVMLELLPYTAASHRVVALVSPSYGPRQYLLLENRTHAGFDAGLPGGGLLVWRVDEALEMFDSFKAGLLLIQADGLHQLEKRWKLGDAGDPFPGSAGKTYLNPKGSISTSFPDAPASGITLDKIKLNARTGAVTLRVSYDGS